MAEVLTKAGVLLAIIALGYLLKRGGIFRRTDYEVVSKIVFRITLPRRFLRGSSQIQLCLL